MIVAGADPGLDGAVAFLDAETHRIVGIVDMPVAKKTSGRREILLRELALAVGGTLDGRRVGHIVIERQQPFAGGDRTMGAASAFALGECYAAVKMLAAAAGWPTRIVTPGSWKRTFGLTKDKDQAVAEAGRLMPEDADWWRQKRGVCTKVQAIARAEAALLALYGFQTLGNIAAGLPQRGGRRTIVGETDVEAKP